jgi:23S rRNA-/tRNA-specific pseudouridylate synthase
MEVVMEVGVLFSSDGILALNKPAGMLSQGPKTSEIPELWELIRVHHPKGCIAHRIDQFTTGINLAGISRCQISYLMRNWHQITRKMYLAIIRNPAWNEKVVSKSLKGKSAVTAFTVLEQSGMFALVQCQLVQNGRMHQIRRHLKSIGSPIVGDRKYKGPKTEVRSGQLLHAWRMEVRLPDDFGKPGPWVTIQAPIPDDFRQFRFDWSHWNEGASGVLEFWPVPSDWHRKTQQN